MSRRKKPTVWLSNCLRVMRGIGPSSVELQAVLAICQQHCVDVSLAIGTRELGGISLPEFVEVLLRANAPLLQRVHLSYRSTPDKEAEKQASSALDGARSCPNLQEVGMTVHTCTRVLVRIEADMPTHINTNWRRLPQPVLHLLLPLHHHPNTTTPRQCNTAHEQSRERSKTKRRR